MEHDKPHEELERVGTEPLDEGGKRTRYHASVQDILGQSRAIDALQSNLQSGRLHHAYIFHGPKGVGKFTTAQAFARILLCHDGQTTLTGQTEACGQCDACRMMNASGDEESAFDRETHPDYHVIRKELAGVSSVATLRTRKQMNIPIDLLREHMIGGKTNDDRFHDALAYKTAQLRHNKVFIIDEAELLDQYGQNSLLKTLEEPPAGTYIILVTSSEDHLLPTIRSRSQRVPFAPLPDNVTRDWIEKNAAGMKDNHKDWLVQFCSGSLGLAALALNFDLLSWAKTVLPALNDMQKDRYPSTLGSDMTEFIKQFAESWVDEHKNASKDAANKQAASLMWTLITQYARHQISKLADHCEPGDLLGSDAALQPWLSVIDSVREAEQALASNVNIGMVADAVVASMFECLSPVGAR